jgi:hypothetical protein
VWYVGINVTLYAKGEVVGMSRLNMDDHSGGTIYMGKDVMGSVRGITDIYGVLEGRYEYDVVGAPSEGGDEPWVHGEALRPGDGAVRLRGAGLLA